MKIRDLRSGGYFIEHLPNGDTIHHKNTLVKQGANWFLRTIFRGEAVLPATYYIGLTNASYTFDQANLLTALNVGEPAGHGYARQGATKNTVDWTVTEVNGVFQAISKVVTFTASSDWDKQWQRMFLCDQAAGTAGDVIAVSGPAPALRTVLSGNGPSIQYAFYLRG